MKSRVWIKEQRENVYFVLLGVFLTGLACSKFLMSVSFIGYTLVFLLFGDYALFRDRWLTNKKWISVLLLLFLAHVISLCWTQDLSAGWNAIRVRLSFFALPVLISTTLTWDKDRIVRVFKFLMLLLAVLMVLNGVRFLYLLNGQKALDIRQLSWFGSHIRFGILVVFSIALCLHFALKKLLSKGYAWSYIVLATAYVLYSQTFSAIGCLLITFGYFGTMTLLSKQWTKVLFIGLLALGLCVSWFVVGDFLKAPEACGSFKDVGEASMAWNRKSKVDFNGNDRKGQVLQRTCERYLCSLGKPLTPSAIQRLEKEAIIDIENGFTDPYSAKGNMLGRYFEVKYEFHLAKDPNGHSLLQRFIYWETAVKLIEQNPLWGVGIGDIDRSMKKAYENTALLAENQKRPHNMFLTTWLGCGLIGVGLLLGLIIWQLFLGLREKQGLKALLMLIFLFSMMLEDSLETQAGASFTGLFLGLLLSKEALAIWSLKND
jgi:hypothetical protein